MNHVHNAIDLYCILLYESDNKLIFKVASIVNQVVSNRFRRKYYFWIVPYKSSVGRVPVYSNRVTPIIRILLYAVLFALQYYHCRMIHILRNKYLPTFAFWPYPFLPLPKIYHDHETPSSLFNNDNSFYDYVSQLNYWTTTNQTIKQVYFHYLFQV